jgi:hypothetical protein
VIDFVRDAPAGALVLVVAGVVLLALEVPARVRWWRRSSRVIAGVVGEDTRPLLPLMMTSAGWALLVGGLAWYVLAG